jgi:poly-beta-hydroxyalkanoate depolymerase
LGSQNNLINHCGAPQPLYQNDPSVQHYGHFFGRILLKLQLYPQIKFYKKKKKKKKEKKEKKRRGVGGG